ncbi:deoxyribose-phosphate aldolase [Marinicrinis sediminis]|uniref:Deoxyribose-phosphate aldolase n=1 Tax=Marinicrinis sediminis TaxID=1652465 RepID=A0ABW5RFZ7_9BACL
MSNTAVRADQIDHTLLKPDATREQVMKLIEEAREHGFASVCVNPRWVETAARQLKGTAVKVCTVIGFPLGATLTEVKAAETSMVIAQGAQEVDMVLSIGDLKDGNLDGVRRDIAAVVEAARGQALVKVIIETSLLTDEEKKKACTLAEEAGAQFVKTSTGFSGGGATVSDIRLMKETVGERLEVKASGGIRTKEDAGDLIAAGASRLGASSGVKIIGGGERDQTAAQPSTPSQPSENEAY